MAFKLLSKTFRIYSIAYLILFIISPLYVAFSFILLHFMSENPENLQASNHDSIALLISSISFFIWWRIFLNLSKAFSLNVKFENKIVALKNLGKLFCISFAVDLISTIAKSSILFNTPTDWTKVLFPDTNLHWAEFSFRLFLWSFKLIVKIGDFITPTTMGLSSLAIGIICYGFGNSPDRKNITDAISGR